MWPGTEALPTLAKLGRPPPSGMDGEDWEQNVALLRGGGPALRERGGVEKWGQGAGETDRQMHSRPTAVLDRKWLASSVLPFLLSSNYWSNTYYVQARH